VALLSLYPPKSLLPWHHHCLWLVANTSKIPGYSNPPPPPVEVDGHLEFEIAQVLDTKLDHRRSEPLLYYMQWAGYEGTAEEYSWLPAADLANATELVADFHRQYPEKPSPET